MSKTMRLDSTKHHSPKRENGLQEIEQRFKGKTSRGSDILAQHSHDESFHLPSRPDIVVFAESTEDVSDCLAICTRHQLPVIPFGVGTSLEGHVNALHGGVSLVASAPGSTGKNKPWLTSSLASCFRKIPA